MTNPPATTGHRSQRVKFKNDSGQTLAGIIEWPREDPPQRVALFSHCFTCTKDLKAIVRISRQLAKRGVAVLRFDFTGLGDSQGTFSDTTFDHNVADVLAASRHLAEIGFPPQILIGHSLGGAAMVAACGQVSTAQAVVNIASPANTRHLAEFLSRSAPEIEARGEGEVVIGGRKHQIRRPMLDRLRTVDLPTLLSELKLPLLILFSPADETLPFHHALEMFRLAGGPSSLINLRDADHLLVNDPADPVFVADMIATWAERYVESQIQG